MLARSVGVCVGPAVYISVHMPMPSPAEACVEVGIHWVLLRPACPPSGAQDWSAFQKQAVQSVGQRTALTRSICNFQHGEPAGESRKAVLYKDDDNKSPHTTKAWDSPVMSQVKR